MSLFKYCYGPDCKFFHSNCCKDGQNSKSPFSLKCITVLGNKGVKFRTSIQKCVKLGLYDDI